MSNLVRLVYVSRALFPASNNLSAVEPEVARILAVSRTNNKKDGLVGVLYYGNGCFFQCIEGETQAIDLLYAKLHHDTRHNDLKLLSRREIGQLSFEKWSMKYVSVDSDMKILLASQGHAIFDPYKFKDETVQAVLALLQKSAAEASLNR